MLPAFRDWIIPNFYYHQDNLGLSISSLEQNVYNILVQVMPGYFIVLLYSLIWLIAGLYLCFKAFKKISKDHNFLSIQANSVLTLFYVINIWTIERLLMGQIHILRGHLLFPIVFYLALKTLGGQKTKDYIYSLLGIFVIGFISIHHLYLLILSLAIYYIFYFLETKKKISIKKKIYGIIVSITSFIPAIIYSIFQLAKSNQSSFYTDTIALQNTSKNDIISSFSLKINEFIGVDNIFVAGILGGGSWMNNTFFEMFEIQDKLGYFKYFLPYFNPLLSYLFAGLLILIIAISISKNKFKSYNKIYYSFIAIFSLMLSFGYSIPLIKNINYIFYQIPSTYILRESGKFYSLFLFGLIVVLIGLLKDYFGRAIVIVVSLFTLLNTILAIFVVANLNLQSHPLILENINKYCKNNKIKKSLYLPNQTYIQSEFSGDIFIENYWYHGSNCNFIKSEYSTIGSSNSTINSTDFDIQFRNLLNNYSCNQTEFLNFLKDSEIDLIAIDLTYYPQLETISNCLIETQELIFDQNGILVIKI